MKFGCDKPVDGVPMAEAGHAKPFNSFPHTIHPGPGDHFLHLAEKLVGVINAGNAPEAGNKVHRQEGIEIDSADAVYFLDQQVEKKAELVFYIKAFAAAEPGVEAMLAEGLGGEGGGVAMAAADEGDVEAGPGQGGADTDHPLVEDKIIRNGEKEPFAMGHSA
jgi:hypothetical protein